MKRGRIGSVGDKRVRRSHSTKVYFFHNSHFMRRLREAIHLHGDGEKQISFDR